MHKGEGIWQVSTLPKPAKNIYKMGGENRKKKERNGEISKIWKIRLNLAKRWKNREKLSKFG